MKQRIQKNREELFRLFGAVEVTGSGNDTQTFEEGVEHTVELIQEMSSGGGKLIWVGNGGSSAMASHFTTDFLKNAGIPSISFNDGSQLTCISNDLGYEQVFARPFELLAQPQDILVAISSSGASRNIIQVVDKAEEKSVKVITLSGFDADNPLRGRGKINFYVPSRHYGHVEDIHHSICHCLIDMVMLNKRVLQKGNS